MTTKVPFGWTVAPASLADSYKIRLKSGQKGSAKGMWPTIPSPKKELTLPLVRSISWSGISRSPGFISSLKLPAEQLADGLALLAAHDARRVGEIIVRTAHPVEFVP